MYYSKIVATGAYAPPKVITNDALSKIVDTNHEWIVSRSGIGNRHFSQGENTADISAKAAEIILKRAGKSGEDVDLIIVATVSGDYSTPSTACLVQAKIGATNAVAFDLSAACSGFIFALLTADKFIRTGVYKNALVLGSEVLSKHLDFNDRSTCVLFGDGGGGVYIEQSDTPSILAENMGSDGTKGMALTAGDFPVSHIYHQPENGVRGRLKMDGKEIFDFATRTVPKSINKLLEDAGESREHIDWVISHQANQRIIEIVSRKVKIPLEKFYMNMYEYGNTSSATIPLVLDEMMNKDLIKEGQKIIICGFGAGLTWGAALIQF